MRTRRPRGRILVDGGFISDQNLYRALHEHSKTNELIGGVLVKMGIASMRSFS